MTKLPIESPAKGTEGRLACTRRRSGAEGDFYFQCRLGRFLLTNYDIYLRIIDPEAALRVSGEYKDWVEVADRKPGEKPMRKIVVKFLRCHSQMVLPTSQCPSIGMCKGICVGRGRDICKRRYAKLRCSNLLVRIEDKDAAFWQKADHGKYKGFDGILDYTCESMQPASKEGL